MRKTHELLHLRNLVLYSKIPWTQHKLYLIIILFDEAFNMAMVQNFDCMVGQTLELSV
jgi:hypothetical protein